jgi:hydrogenase maturation protease
VARLAPQRNFDHAMQHNGSNSMNTLIIGCGNLLRGDDGVGSVFIRRLLDCGLPPCVEVADAGTAGMDVAFRMRGAAQVILVDACRSGTAPGSLFRVPGEQLENLPPTTGIHLHAFRWDHALAFARWLLKEEYPQQITVYLVEAAQFEPGAPLSPPVDAALDQLARIILEDIAAYDVRAVGA